jgi:hypothetical protein
MAMTIPADVQAPDDPPDLLEPESTMTSLLGFL